MTMPGLRPRSSQQAFAAGEFAVGRIARPTMLAVGWRWRYEALLVIATTVGTCLLAHLVGWLGTCILTGVAAGSVILVPPLRAKAAAFAWWIVTPHRVRTGMAQAWVHSRDGKIPVVLRTSQQRYGERVHVWCRAGTSVEDFIWAQHLITAACWARDVRVSCSKRYPHVVILDIVRRDMNQHGEAWNDFWSGVQKPGPVSEAERRQPHHDLRSHE